MIVVRNIRHPVELGPQSDSIPRRGELIKVTDNSTTHIKRALMGKVQIPKPPGTLVGVISVLCVLSCGGGPTASDLSPSLPPEVPTAELTATPSEGDLPLEVT